MRALATIAVLLASEANAAIALESGFPVNKTQASAAQPVAAVTATCSTTAAALIVVAVSLECVSTGGAAGAVTDNTGVTGAYTNRKTATWTGGSFNGYGKVDIWTATASAAFTGKTFTVTMSCGAASNVAGSFSVYALTGADTSSFGATDGGGSTSDAATHLIAGNLTTTVDQSFLVGSGLDGNAAGTYTAQAGTTLDTNFSIAGFGTKTTSFHKTGLGSNATNYTVGTTTTDAYYGYTLLEIKPDGGGGATPPPTRTLLGVGT
jgi:hypothetical protein